MAARTGAERYFEKQRKDPEYERAYREASASIRAVDALVRSIDERREAWGLSKAELARRAGLPPETVRRLFTMRSPNPTATTIAALANALDLNLVTEPRRASGWQVRKAAASKAILSRARTSKQTAPSGASRTRRGNE
ncbi:MAG: helix-turn-helix domain-containing protein [Actinobacteria bacterium]|nr:helix-turn-helix domain-containing protein [Actinomycetota bacterium]